MAVAQIAILEGYTMARRRRRRYGSPRRTHRRRAYHGRRSQRTKFSHAAKTCSRVVRSRGGSFRACMRRHLKRGRR